MLDSTPSVPTLAFHDSLDVVTFGVWSDPAAPTNTGYNVAVVFNTKKGVSLPREWKGYPVYDGDETDVRFYDPPNHVIGLHAKGEAKKDKTGFVINVNNIIWEQTQNLILNI